MYETCKATVTVTDYDLDKESDILRLLEGEGYVCYLDRGVISANRSEPLPREADSEALARKIVDVDRNCDDCDYDCFNCDRNICGGPGGCSECKVDVTVGRFAVKHIASMRLTST